MACEEKPWYKKGVWKHYRVEKKFELDDLPGETNVAALCFYCNNRRSTWKSITSNLVRHLKVLFDYHFLHILKYLVYSLLHILSV